jgi:hypothetical protein
MTIVHIPLTTHLPFASSEVEKPVSDKCFSTSLETNGWGKVAL